MAIRQQNVYLFPCGLMRALFDFSKRAFPFGLAYKNKLKELYRLGSFQSFLLLHRALAGRPSSSFSWLGPLPAEDFVFPVSRPLINL